MTKLELHSSDPAAPIQHVSVTLDMTVADAVRMVADWVVRMEKHGPVAQTAEQPLCKGQGLGSTPSRSSNFDRVSQRTEAAGPNGGDGGSNPSAVTNTGPASCDARRGSGDAIGPVAVDFPNGAAIASGPTSVNAALAAAIVRSYDEPKPALYKDADGVRWSEGPAYAMLAPPPNLPASSYPAAPVKKRGRPKKPSVVLRTELDAAIPACSKAWSTAPRLTECNGWRRVTDTPKTPLDDAAIEQLVNCYERGEPGDKAVVEAYDALQAAGWQVFAQPGMLEPDGHAR